MNRLIKYLFSTFEYIHASYSNSLHTNFNYNYNYKLPHQIKKEMLIHLYSTDWLFEVQGTFSNLKYWKHKKVAKRQSF